MLVAGIAAQHPKSAFFISSAMALVFLIIDLAITIKGSMPLNALTHTYNPGNESVHWEMVRTQWLDYMKYRGIFITMGMASLLGGLIFGKS
jgi:uncharacterized membrane protein